MELSLYKSEYKINEHITIKIPLMKDIVIDEDNYYGNITLLTATPFDMMVQLDDIGIDFTTINEWDLFCLLFQEIKSRDFSLIFDNLNFNDFETAINKQNENVILINKKTGAIIDRGIHYQISDALRKILSIEKNEKRPANEAARKFLIERARRRLKRKSKQNNDSQLENYIVALVNTPEFPYNYSSLLELTIYQFNASLNQIIKKVRYDNLMIGCYAGTVNMKELDQKELSWISI